jgi:hypothetical protein
MPRLPRVLCLLFLFAWTAGAQTFSREQVLADLDYLIADVERVHPDPYGVRSRDQLAAERQRLADSLPASLTIAEVWTRLAPFAAGYRDGHTGLPMPTVIGPRFPAAFRLVEGELVVIYSAFHGIEKGDRILRINGRSVQELLSQWELAIAGELDPARRAAAAAWFPRMLQLHGIRGPYEVVAAGADGVERKVTVPAIPSTGLGQAVAAEAFGPLLMQPAAGAERKTAFSFTRPNADAGYLRVYTFSLEKDERFEKDLMRAMRELAADHARTLIIDVRGNSGGFARYVTTLLETFANREFEDSAGEWKVSEETRTKKYRGWVRAVGLDRLLKSSGGLSAWAPVKHKPKPRFTGNVCILTDATSYSAAIRLADIAQYYKFATILGEETGGTANMHGNALPFQLPNSHLTLTIASARFWRANGERADRTAVRPDIALAPTIADIAAGRDPVLERALNCPSLL